MFICLGMYLWFRAGLGLILHLGSPSFPSWDRRPSCKITNSLLPMSSYCDVINHQSRLIGRCYGKIPADHRSIETDSSTLARRRFHENVTASSSIRPMLPEVKQYGAGTRQQNHECLLDSHPPCLNIHAQ